MSRCRLVLIRHGHTAHNAAHPAPRLSGITDFPLSAEGEREVALLAAHLVARRTRFGAICASPLVRARDTARPLAEAGLGELSLYEGLREIDCGAYDGMEIEEVKRLAPALWRENLRQENADFRWPGGESYREFRARCVGTISAIAERFAGEQVALITHAGVISQLLGSLAGTSPARWELFRPSNASISELEWGGVRRVLLRFDERAHLG